MASDEILKSTDNSQKRPINWAIILRVTLKAAGLFLLLNVLFAILYPLETLGSLSLYNWLLPGRQRLPYGENPAESYNLSLDNIPAMMASHMITRPKAVDEFRILVIGDSGTWGWFLENDDTLAAQINAGNYQTADGRHIIAYNLGYPIMALSKDLLLLEEAMSHDPDLILWPVTLQSFPRDQQLVPPLVQNNPQRVRALVEDYGLDLDPNSPELNDPDFLDRTILGQRRALADLLRLQSLGFSWAATGIDQAIPLEIPLRAVDLDPDLSWMDVEQPVPLTGDLLALDAIEAGLALAGDVPVLIVNEPIFISDGQNSRLRYNAWYPRWAYDGYRELLLEVTAERDWPYLDLWDRISPSEFTDSPVHLTPSGTRQLAELLVGDILQLANESPGN
jgi:lysophospholipase L1-like esterase